LIVIAIEVAKTTTIAFITHVKDIRTTKANTELVGWALLIACTHRARRQVRTANVSYPLCTKELRSTIKVTSAEIAILTGAAHALISVIPNALETRCTAPAQGAVLSSCQVGLAGSQSASSIGDITIVVTLKAIQALQVIKTLLALTFFSSDDPLAVRVFALPTALATLVSEAIKTIERSFSIENPSP
jgi:hypothetical protein